MSSQEQIDANISSIASNILDVYKDITMSDFFGCLVKLMESAELLPSLAGADKKKVVKGVLNQLISKINFPKQGEKQLLEFIVNSGLIDLIIDGIVDLTKNGCQINIEQLAQKCCCGGKCIIV